MGWVSRNRTIRPLHALLLESQLAVESEAAGVVCLRLQLDAPHAGDLPFAFDNVKPARPQQAVEDSAESVEVHGIMAERRDDPAIHVNPMDLPDVFGVGKARYRTSRHFLRAA